MPSKGKLLSDYTNEEWGRLRQFLIKPSLEYWITIAALSFLLLLSGLSRLVSEGFTFESILLTSGGIILVILLVTNIVYRISRKRKK